VHDKDGLHCLVYVLAWDLGFGTVSFDCAACSNVCRNVVFEVTCIRSVFQKGGSGRSSAL
jgi:hypothetical protein